jgi:hypothetical protein
MAEELDPEEIEIDLTNYFVVDRGFTGGNPACMHMSMAEWDGEDETRDLDICKSCGARRVSRWA